MRKGISIFLSLLLVFSLVLLVSAKENDGKEIDPNEPVRAINTEPPLEISELGDGEPITAVYQGPPLELSFAEIPIDTRPVDEIFPPESRINTRGISGTFNDLAAGSYAYLTECVVTQGQTVLRVTSANWHPANKIAIGLFPSHPDGNTQYQYHREFEGGAITLPAEIDTDGVPSGTYWAYVKNMGPGRIATGLLQYEIRD